jgi:hypothetical protein
VTASFMGSGAKITWVKCDKTQTLVPSKSNGVARCCVQRSFLIVSSRPVLRAESSFGKRTNCQTENCGSFATCSFSNPSASRRMILS